MRAALNDYRVNARKSLVRAEASVKRLQTFFRGQKALDITPDRMQAYIAARLRSGAKPATIQKERAALVRMFTLAVASGRLALRPTFPTIEVRNVRTGFFEEPELRRVLAHLRGTSFRLCCSRTSPAGARARCSGSDGTRLTSPRARSGWSRGPPRTTRGGCSPSASSELNALLVQQRRATEGLQRATGHIVPYVFHRRGGPIRGFRRAWVTACKQAGVIRLFHDLRRTAVRNLERKAVPRSWAMRLTGHKTEAVYRRYAIVSERGLARSCPATRGRAHGHNLGHNRPRGRS